MSYSRKECRTEFSNEQIISIYAWSGSIQRQPLIQTTILENRIINNNLIISDDFVKVRNVTINNNANVIIETCKETTIEHNFEIQLGSQLEIK